MGERQINIAGQERAKPDLKRLSRALLALAAAQAEAEAQRAHTERVSKPDRERSPRRTRRAG